ncbi:hypothetical protein AB3X82_07290 [Paraburkholderia phenoliruptrix]|uniref:GIY-YIG domain-containing protein n=1 Tax=Paraburkholderia phenoliruptrix TaxID=252970 RepID=A0ABV3WGV7_9BURK
MDAQFDAMIDWFKDHPEVLTHSEDVIVRSARRYERYGGDHTPPTFHGIYFLVHSGEIVYVGKTESIGSRLAAHWLRKKFDSYWCFGDVPYEWLEYIENLYIMRILPRLNRAPFVRAPNEPPRLREITDKLQEIALAHFCS